jgi:hypothetical protein
LQTRIQFSHDNVDNDTGNGGNADTNNPAKQPVSNPSGAGTDTKKNN